MNQIQVIFFENLKQIFNTYNTFYENVEKESRANIALIDKQISVNSAKVFY